MTANNKQDRKRYKLLKDLPSLAAGAVFEVLELDPLAKQPRGEDGEYYEFTDSQMASNSEWFELIPNQQARSRCCNAAVTVMGSSSATFNGIRTTSFGWIVTVVRAYMSRAAAHRDYPELLDAPQIGMDTPQLGIGLWLKTGSDVTVTTAEQGAEDQNEMLREVEEKKRLRKLITEKLTDVARPLEGNKEELELMGKIFPESVSSDGTIKGELIHIVDAIIVFEKLLAAELEQAKREILDTSKVTRVEVVEIDKGRSYLSWKPSNRVELSFQDDDRTLKIFITTHGEE